ncbi:hypothetical protein CORC01_07300 [Colletotrichum orchidophilum]|uniref:Uncharacterized protein n=1 Tax=Colletotrichum orchidophilum TaxID=1209926 RepID=A0A1G4B7Z8_9PEZI|nr:uncharacterized protein CORC01_07300 [Colletotrichum orchidophilum]OHE97395.1 hypothetical protein CORC01_07300 [Colletotrichum orchidophilum]
MDRITQTGREAYVDVKMMQVSFESPAPPTSEASCASRSCIPAPRLRMVGRSRPAAALRSPSDRLLTKLPPVCLGFLDPRSERPHLQESNIPPSKAQPTRDVSSEDYLAATASHRCWPTNGRLHINVWCAGPGVSCVMKGHPWQFDRVGRRATRGGQAQRSGPHADPARDGRLLTRARALARSRRPVWKLTCWTLITATATT